MCDYSLNHVASRSAKVGDKLSVTSFHGTWTQGFAAVDEPNTAVCLLPGTEIAFDKEVWHGTFWRSKNTGQKAAVFRQLDKHTSGTFHDALEFADGQIVLLTRLRKGQRATVLQLPAVPGASHGAEKVERTEVPADQVSV